jgi:hypothetical protein
MANRLLADVHFDVQVCKHLRAIGYQVQEARLLKGQRHRNRMSDESLLDYARQLRAAILTDNVADFRKLHIAMPWHEGIVACPLYDNARRKADRIHRLLERSKLKNGRFTGKWMRLRPELSPPANS